MEIRKIPFRKSVKFLTLLLTSMLIATASATIYNYMFLNANIGVEGMTLEWKLGVDNATAGTQIAGVTATLTNLKGPPNGTRVYGDPVRLKNTAGSGSTTFDLVIDTVSGDTVNMSSIVVRLYSLNTSAYIQNVTVWSGGAKGSDANNLPIPAGHIWRFEWEISWKSIALVTDSVTVNLKIKVPV